MGGIFTVVGLRDEGVTTLETAGRRNPLVLSLARVLSLHPEEAYMSAMRILALVLIVIGALMLASPVISYTTRDKVVDLGPIEVTQEDNTIPVPPILGGIAVVAGIALLVTGGRRTA